MPQCLRSALGKTEIIRSLGTREPLQAVRLARLLANHIDRLFAESQRAMARKPPKFLRLDWVFEIHPDGRRELKITPDDTRALSEAWMSPKQIADHQERLLAHAAATAVPTAPTPPYAATGVKHGTTLNNLIESFNADRIAKQRQQLDDPFR